MSLSDIQKKEIKALIQGDCRDYLEEMDGIKNDFDETAKNVEEKYGMKKAAFKKIAQMYYKSSLEEEKAKAEELFNLYAEVIK